MKVVGRFSGPFMILVGSLDISMLRCFLCYLEEVVVEFIGRRGCVVMIAVIANNYSSTI